MDHTDHAMTIQDIMDFLPHRYPMVLVDRVVGVTKNPAGSANHIGEKIVAIKNVTINEPFFTGHFPDLPVMPGVLIVEAMAQSCALLAKQPHPTGGKWNFFIMGVDNARFRRTVVPGDQLEMHCTIIKDRRTIFAFQCEARVNGEVAAEAEILAKMF